MGGFLGRQEISRARSLCLSDSPRTLIFALLADGVPRDQLYPLDIDRAFNKLDQIKPHVKVWWREGTQSQQLIRDGEVDMMSIWNARASELKQQGVPVEVVWNGAVRSTSTWSVLKGAPNRKLAWELIAFASQAKPQAEFNTRLFYGPIHPDAYAFIPRISPSSCRPTRTTWRFRSRRTISGRQTGLPRSRSGSCNGSPHSATATEDQERCVGKNEFGELWR